MPKPRRVRTSDLLIQIEADDAGNPVVRDVVQLDEDYPDVCCSEHDCRCMNGWCRGYRNWSTVELDPHRCDQCPQTPDEPVIPPR